MYYIAVRSILNPILDLDLTTFTFISRTTDFMKQKQL